MTGNKLVYASLIAILSFSLLAMPTTGTSAEEVYTLVTMWPEFPQLWYFDKPYGIVVDGSGNDIVQVAQLFEIETRTIILDDVPNSFPMFSNAEYVNFTIEKDTITLTLDLNASFDGICNIPNRIGTDISVVNSSVELEYFPITYQNFSYDQKWRSAPYFDDTKNRLYLLSGSGNVSMVELEIEENTTDKTIPKVVGVGDLVGQYHIETTAEGKNSTYNNLISSINGVGYADLYAQYALDTSHEKTPFIPTFAHCERLQGSMDSIISGSESIVKYSADVLGMAKGAVPISEVSHDWNLALDLNVEYFPITYQNFSYNQKWQVSPYFNDTDNRLYLLSGSGIASMVELEIEENTTDKTIPKVVGVGDLVGQYHIETTAEGKNSTYNNLISSINGVGYADLYVQYALDTSHKKTPFIPTFAHCEQLQGSMDSIISGSESIVEYSADVLGMAKGAVPISEVSHDWNLALDLNVEYFPKTYQNFSYDQKWQVSPYFNDTENRLYLLSGSGSIPALNLEIKENSANKTIPKIVGVGGLVGELYNDTIAKGINASYNNLVSSITGSGNANLYVQYAPNAPVFYRIPDLIITDIYQEGSTIYYRLKNQGTADAGSCYVYLYVDGTKKAENYVSSISAGSTRAEHFDYAGQCTGSEDTIKVCADATDKVEESNETNNCREEKWDCPNQPPVNPKLTPNKAEPQYNGTAVTWTASATDPDGDTLYYQFWVRGPASADSWTIKRDWSANSTWTWHTSSVDIGDNNISVWIRDGHHEPADKYDLQEVYSGYNITPVDTTAPELTCPADVTVELETKEGTVVHLEVTATDNYDPNPAITSNEPDIYPLGTTTVTFTATDASGNSASCSVNVTVSEIPPFAITIISPEEGATYETTSVDLTFIITEHTRWVGYSMDGSENITISGNTTLKKLTNGPHNLTIYADLLTGNIESNTVFFAVSAIAPTIVNVTVSPTYALPGDCINITADVFDHSGIRWVIASVTKGQEEIGNIWLSASNTEEDIYTGTWDIPIFDKGGIYNITIYATDTEGNEATAEPQRVEVPTDTEAPVITNIAVSPTYAVSCTPIFISVEVTDHLSGVKDVKGIVSKDGEEVSTIPMLDPDEDGIYTGTWHTTIFTVGGIYNIELRATDNSGNEASADAHAVRIVRDTEGPIVRIISPEEGVAYPATEIALEVAADVVIANWSYSLNGAATVSFTPNTTITAREGSNSLVVSAEDMTGNVSSSAVSFLVDTTPPVIICPPDVTVEQETSEGAVVHLDVTVSDLCDPDPEVTSNERDIYPPGTTTVTFTATDASGNNASCSVNVIIIPVCEGPINSNGGPWLFHGEGYWIDMDITTPATKVSTKPQDYTGIEDLISVQPGETVRVKAIVDYSGYTESPDCIMFQRVFSSWEPSTVLAELYTGQLPADLMEKTITFIAPTEPGEYKLHLNFVTAYNPPGDYCDGNIVETTLIVEPEIMIRDYKSRVIKGQINLFNVTIGNLGKFREENLTVELKEGEKIMDNATIEHIDSNVYKTVILKWETENAALGIHEITTAVLGEDKESLTDITEKVSVLAQSKAKTLIATNLRRFEEVENKLILLSHHPSVNGIILNVANDQNCSEAYESWDSNRSSENANAVARAIKELIDSSLAVYENIEYIIIAGNDEVIPFYRIQDKSVESYVGSYGLYDEKDYIKDFDQLKRTTAIGSAFWDNMFLTDDFYADFESEDLPEGIEGELYIPDKPLGRLVETPAEISKTVEIFSKKGDIVAPNKIFITSYDFMNDTGGSCASIWSSLSTPVFMGKGIKEHGTYNDSTEIVNELLNASNNIVAIFQHADHQGFAIEESHDFVTSNIISNSSSDLNGSIVYSMSCHAGLNVPKDEKHNYDLVQAFMGKGVLAYVAPTSWGIGGVVTEAGHERLMRYFTKHLCEGMDAGTALIRAKQDYYATDFDFDYIDQKVVSTSVLYGLPMYGVNIEVETEGIMKVMSMEKPQTFTFRPEYSEIETPVGNYTSAHETLSAPGKPVLPKFIWPYTMDRKMLHGITLTNASYELIENTAIPYEEIVISIAGGYLQPISTNENWNPATFFKITTIGKKQNIILITGQFKKTGWMRKGGEKVNMGHLRRYTELTFDLYLSSTEDEKNPPKIQVNPTNASYIKVNATDESGIRKIVVAYTDNKGKWGSFEIVPDVLACTLKEEIELEVGKEYFVQVVDIYGNVVVDDNRGRYYVSAQKSVDFCADNAK